MTNRLTITKSDTKYLRQKMSVGDEKVMTPKSKTVSFDKIIRFESANIPFVYLNEEAFGIGSRKILSKYLRKYALAWINLANK